MIKNALIAAAMLVSTPVLANDFGGVYGELTAGYDNVTNSPDKTDASGAAVGVNVPVGKTIVGVEATVDNVFDRRDIGANLRVGYPIGNVMPYAKVGYANYKDAFSRKLDGLRVSGGLEYNISSSTYIKAEYRYSDFDKNTGKHGVLGGIGVRF